MNQTHLGGRIELLEPSEMTGSRENLYHSILKEAVPWAQSSGFIAALPDGKVIGPFNLALQSPEIGAAFAKLQSTEESKTTLNPRVRQIVILTVGALWQCDYERYAHKAVAQKLGLAQQSIDAVAEGSEQPQGLTQDELLAYRLTKQILTNHKVSQDLFDKSQAAFGNQGIVDLLFLAGCYVTVSSLLNTFEVPVPDNGADSRFRSQAPSGHHAGDQTMSHNNAPQAALSVVAEFPKQYFLENLVVRRDNSVLIHVANKKELWYVPPADGHTRVTPALLHAYQENAAGMVELEPDVFVLLTGNVYTTHESFLHRLDLRDWAPGTPVSPQLICQFPERARGVNGCCLIAPDVLLVADCFAGLIWRVDFPKGGAQPSFRVWLEHESMGYFPGKMKPEQPGVNGVRYGAKTHYVYYSATAKKLFMRVSVHPETLEPAGDPELVVAGRMGDDFLIDEDAQVVYLTTHRQNTIDVVSMDPGLNSGFTQSIAGEPSTPELIGPSAGAWRRGPNDLGRVAYFTTDGGTASPPPAGPTPAKLLRIELQPLPNGFPAAG